jgi:thiol-disulfide isomerase/thioredoxin
MLSRRAALLSITALAATPWAQALAASPQAFDQKKFDAAQKASEPILVAIDASWCPTCAAQKPILSTLLSELKFGKLQYFVVDFDSQKALVHHFGARTQSTLIAFHGATDRGRSVGDTNKDTITALVAKEL